MGREALCEARLGKQTSRGKALLETSDLLFRGDFRVAVPFKEMTRVRADTTKLTVAWKDKPAPSAGVGRRRGERISQ